MNQSHFTKLKNMYLSANVNRLMYETTTIEIKEGEAEIGLTLSEKYYHALDAVHGSVYFKLLDDACFFAVNSLVEDVFVLTTSFEIELKRPVGEGKILARGTVTEPGEKIFHASAVLYNEANKEIARGQGTFVKSKEALSPEIGYR